MAEAFPLDTVWSIDDHLVALAARVKPMKVIGVDVFKAALEMVKALWPDEKPPSSAADLADRLTDGPARLDDWRASAARVGADESLSYVLSWYETIRLDLLKHMRIDGIYEKDPELKQKRQELAYSYVEYADIHTFREDPKASAAAADEGEGEEAGEEEASDDIEEIDTLDTDITSPAAGPDLEKAKTVVETPPADVPSSSGPNTSAI